MKKRFFAAGLALALSVAATTVAIPVAAEVSLEECDKVFAATMNALIDESDVKDGVISSTRKPLYDISVQPLGCVYEFSLKDSEGYAIVVNTDGNYVVQEVMPDAVSPYANSEGQCIYVGNMTYLEYSDGVYTDAESGVVLPDEVVEYLAEDALYGDDGLNTGGITVNIPYKSRTQDDYWMAPSTPDYHTSPYVSSCACIAGANVVGYFDRYCPNLIADFEPGYEYMGYYFYYGETSEITPVVTQLYSDMGTTASAGTTTAQFLSGMSKYANRAGYTFRYSSCMSGGSFNFSQAKSGMQNGRPTVLFLTGYNVAKIGLLENRDSIAYVLSAANHVMVGFGYNIITYTYDSGEQETFNYIYVASGAGICPTGYFNINYNTKINDAYAVSIN